MKSDGQPSHADERRGKPRDGTGRGPSIVAAFSRPAISNNKQAEL